MCSTFESSAHHVRGETCPRGAKTSGHQALAGDRNWLAIEVPSAQVEVSDQFYTARCGAASSWHANPSGEWRLSPQSRESAQGSSIVSTAPNNSVTRKTGSSVWRVRDCGSNRQPSVSDHQVEAETDLYHNPYCMDVLGTSPSIIHASALDSPIGQPQPPVEPIQHGRVHNCILDDPVLRRSIVVQSLEVRGPCRTQE